MMNNKETLRRIEEELYLILSKNIRQELIETIKQGLDRLEQLEKENQELKKAIENSNKAYDVLMQNSNIQFLNQNQQIYKLKKALDILKEKFPIKFLGYNEYGAKPYEIMFNGFITGFDKEPYELLKSVLEEE